MMAFEGFTERETAMRLSNRADQLVRMLELDRCPDIILDAQRALVREAALALPEGRQLPEELIPGDDPFMREIEQIAAREEAASAPGAFSPFGHSDPRAGHLTAADERLLAGGNLQGVWSCGCVINGAGTHRHGCPGGQS